VSASSSSSWAAPGVGQLVETVGGAVVEALHQVSVAVHRHLDRGVAEPGSGWSWDARQRRSARRRGCAGGRVVCRVLTDSALRQILLNDPTTGPDVPPVMTAEHLAELLHTSDQVVRLGQGRGHPAHRNRGVARSSSSVTRSSIGSSGTGTSLRSTLSSSRFFRLTARRPRVMKPLQIAG